MSHNSVTYSPMTTSRLGAMHNYAADSHDAYSGDKDKSTHRAYSRFGALLGSPGAIGRTIAVVFLLGWAIFYLPYLLQGGRSKSDHSTTSSSSARSAFSALVSSTNTDRQVSFVCTIQDINEATLPKLYGAKQHTVALRDDVTPEAMETVIAAACGYTPPILLYDFSSVLQIWSGSLPEGKYIVRPGSEADIAKEQEKQIQHDKEEKDRLEQIEREKERERNERRNEQIQAARQRDQNFFKERTERKRKQLANPPANTDRLIYPNPMRDPSDIDRSVTYLSGAINIGRRKHNEFDEGSYAFEKDYLHIMKVVLSWKLPVQMIMERKYYNILIKEPGVLHDQAMIRIVEKEDLRSWKYYEPIEKIRKSDWINIAGWLPDSPQGYNDLYNPVIMHKVYWIRDLCRLNPFNTTYFMWIDAGLCTKWILPESAEFLSKRWENMMKPGFLATNSPRDGGDEIQGFMRWKLEEMAGQHTTHIMKGGTFGATCPQIERFVEEYDRVLDQSLKEGFLGTEESLYTIVFYKLRDMFYEFKQERPEHPMEEALCLMNDEMFHIPQFGEKYIPDVQEAIYPPGFYYSKN